MLPHPPASRVLLAALFVAGFFATSMAQTPTGADPNAAFARFCHDWGSALRRIAANAKSDAQRDSAINDADTQIETQLKVVDIPSGANFDSVVANLRSCLEREANTAFGQGTTVTVTLRPTIIRPPAQGGGVAVVQSTRVDGTIRVSPGSSVVTVAANQSLGKQWGDVCLSKGSRACCSASANHDCKTLGLCRVAVKICETMVACDLTLNDCKKKTMDDPKRKDPHCDGAACRQCTVDYKKCHDAAVQISN